MLFVDEISLISGDNLHCVLLIWGMSFHGVGDFL